MDDTIETTQAVIDQTQIVKRGLMQELFTPGSPTVTGPSEWSEEHLGSLFTLQLGKMLNKKARITLPRFPYLANKDVQWGKLDLSNLREMHFNDKDREKYRLLPHDLLMCEGGEVGRTAIWTGKFDCYFQNAVHRLRVRDSARVEPHFILHFMRFAAASGMFTHLTGQSTIAHLTKEKLSLLKVNLPTLPEQRKIAAILSSVDDAIEKTQAVIDQARIVKRGLMQELFTRGLPGRSRRLKLTEIGSIPNEWTIRSLADTCIARGQYGANVAKRDFEPGGIRYIRITDIDDDGTLKDEAVGVNTRDADGYLLRTGDILFARSGATVGKTYLHVADDADLRCAFAGYLVRFRTRGQILLPEFLKEYLNTAVYWRWVAARQRAQAQPNINAAEYGQLPVPLPSLDEQRKIADVAAGLNGAIRAAMDAVRGHRRLKRALMSVLLTGELRVTPCYSIADELAMEQAARSSR